MNQKESAGPEQSTPAEAETEVFKGLKSAGLNDRQAFRTGQAVRAQAGHNIKETLELHQGKVDTRVDGVETKLTAKIDGVETELKADRVAQTAELTAKIDRVETELSTSMKAIRRELAFYRWVFIVLLALVSLIVALVAFLIASGLAPKFEQWLWGIRRQRSQSRHPLNRIRPNLRFLPNPILYNRLRNRLDIR